MALPFQGPARVPRKAPEPPREPPKPDFFGPSGSLGPSELIGKLRSASPKIPGTSTEMSTKEKENLAKRFSFRKHGAGFGRDDARRVIKELKEEKNKEKTYDKRLKIDQTIRWLKKTTDTS